MIKKKISQKSKSNIKEISAQKKDLAADKAVVDRELAAKNEKAIKLFESVGPWAELYALSYHELVVYFFVYLGWQEKVIGAAEAEDKEEANMALFRELTDQEEGGDLFNLLDSFDEEKRAEFLSILMAMQGNIEGIRRYHETVSELVSRADIDTEALMKAVAVDRSVVAHVVVAKAISQAQLRQDESFMNRLAKSITRTKPRRKPELDDSRFMLEVIDDLVGLETVSHKEIADVLLDDLALYPDGGQDPDSAIKKLVQKRNMLKGK